MRKAGQPGKPDPRTAHPSGLPVARLLLLVAGVALLGTLGLVHGQQVHHNPFETRETFWVKGPSDAPFRETAHEITDASAHSGQHSEHIQLMAEQGTFIHYYYPVGRAPLGDDLSVSIWVKSNRPGAQLMGRLVLPREQDPRNLSDRLTATLRSEPYQQVGRWQRLELRNPVKLAAEQQRFMRAELARDVNFNDAYIDRLILNVYGGPGQTEVWIDDLEVGPLVGDSPFKATSRPAETPGKGALTAPPRLSRGTVVELRQDHLMAAGKDFFIRGIRHSDTPLRALRDAGFNTVWFDYRTQAAVMEEAANLGFWVVPALPVTGGDPHLASDDGLAGEVSRFLASDTVLFWDLGGGLVDEQKEPVRRAVQVVHLADPQRPVGADIWDGLKPYGRALDLVGFHRWPLMTGLELPQYREWLEQRARLTRPGSFTWTWVQTHLPDWYTTLVYGRPGWASFDEPIGPQPEQIRLLAYTALAAGCRGLGFWSDRFLANSHQGRDRLLQLALLNLEIQMLEPFLMTARPPVWVTTSQPDVRAAVFKTDHGVLVLPIWLGNGAQFVPGQSATAKLSFVVPEVPATAQAWQLSPAEIHTLTYERALAGRRITIPQFDLTAAVLFTSDTATVVRLQDLARRTREQAGHWAHDLAEVELDKVARVDAQLTAAGHPLKEGPELLAEARKRLRACVDSYNGHDYLEAYHHAEEAMQPLRILMRKQWAEATKGLDSPVASPYAVSFYTLPRHWTFMEPFRQGRPGANALRGGDFELSPEQAAETWTVQEARLDAVELTARRVTDAPKEGKQCLMLEIKPQDPQAAPEGLERTFLAINSPAVRLAPGTSVAVSAWVRIPAPIRASVDGALFYDSAGGEPLAVRLTNPTGWKKVTLYRTVPASGLINVTLALTGLGTVYFDDVRIEPVEATVTAQAPDRRTGGVSPLLGAPSSSSGAPTAR